jgi:H+/Cl- antiporter ClcA
VSRYKKDHLGDFTVTPRVLLIAGLAVPVGMASAGLAWVLLRLIGLITHLVFYRTADTSLAAPDGHSSPWLLLLLAPVAGGVAIGLLARYGSEKIRGHGMPEAIEAILLGGSKVAPRVAVLKPLSAAISIGTGGPFGAEGPIIMTGGAFGSLCAQLLRLTADERKTLLVAGATAGMAATFNAPLASVLLAVELLLFEWRPRSLIPVITAVCVSTVTRFPLLGHGRIFSSTAVFHVSTSTYVLCLVSGLASAALAIIATALVYAAEDLFHRLPIHWMWWPALGGLIIGIGGAIEPRALGVGYDVIDELLTGRAGLSLILGILVVKTLIWGLSLGSGTSGGVLAPMFMVGGALGAAEGLVFPHVSPGFWALVSLAGVLGGVMRSPLTGIVFCLELTHEMNALLPMVITASAAYLLSVTLLKRSVLTEKLARRGLHLTREYSVDPLEVHLVRQLETPIAVSFHADDTAGAATAMLRTAHDTADPDGLLAQRLYPVLDEHDHLIGVVTRSQLLHADPADPTPLARLAAAAVTAHPDETLRALANRMAQHGLTRLLVVDHGRHPTVEGIVSLRDLLHARRVDLHEERHAERVLTLRPRRPAAATTG